MNNCIVYNTDLISTRLIDLVKTNNLDFKQLSRDTGISYNALMTAKYGQRIPSTKTFLRLSEYFDVSVDYLLGRVD